MDRDSLGRQLINLGDMIGDGLHHEPDGKWIEVEYRRVMRLLHPEIRKEKRDRNRKLIEIQINELIKIKKCGKCNGDLFQKRKGTRIVYCKLCNARFKAIPKIK